MSEWNAPTPTNRIRKVSRGVLASLSCLVLLGLFACGPSEEEMELVELQEAAPSAGSSAEPAPEEPAATEPGGGPLEETPPERAPLGPELEAPPPPSEGAGAEAGEEAESTAQTEEGVPIDPAELESEIDAAEPVPPAPMPMPTAETQAAGKEVFLGQRCDTCHGVSTADIEGKTASGGDLAGLGDRLDRAAIEALLRGEETASGERHPKKFSGSQDELDALIDWLLAQE